MNQHKRTVPQSPVQASNLQVDANRVNALARLLPLWPSELSDTSIAGRHRIIAVMARALRAERQRGRAGHWAYDLGRHAALARALARERADLAALQQAAAMPKRQQPVA